MTFLEESRGVCSKEIEVFTAEAMEVLLDHPWPGNVRELKNVIRKAVLAEASGRLSASTVRRSLENDEPHAEACPQLKEAVSERERASIVDALKASSNRLQRAASLLGIDRKTLYRKRKKHNLL